LAIIFLIFRELITWYWKINKAISVFERIADSLEDIASCMPEKTEGQVNQKENEIA
jgi:hypothetical protein